MTSSSELHTTQNLVLCNGPAADRQGFRQAVETDIKIALDTSSLTAIILVEIFDFRDLMRIYGFEVSESITARIQSLLQEQIKKASKVSPLADGLFGICVPDLGSSRLLPSAAKKIANLLSIPIQHNNHTIILRAAVGIAIAPAMGFRADEVILSAERALTKAANNSDGYFMLEKSEERGEVAGVEFKVALEKVIANGGLSLFYQPKISLHSFKPVSCEALVRWESQEFGSVSPEKFIAVAEQTDLICELTEWAIMTASREFSARQPDNCRPGFAVNLSARDLLHESLEATLGTAQRVWEVDPERVTLEVTESAVIDNPVKAIDRLHQLREQGFRISIDDFGTGYSSISYLKLIPAQEVKIDQSFVKNLVHDSKDRAIVQAVIELATEFGMQTVGEGVEDAETLQALIAMGCSYAQGYYFMCPKPRDDYIDWINDYQVAKYFPMPAAVGAGGRK